MTLEGPKESPPQRAPNPLEFEPPPPLHEDPPVGGRRVSPMRRYEFGWGLFLLELADEGDVPGLRGGTNLCFALAILG